ncbi:MAG: SDR family oxidoreductase [Syntrophales bacterium]
MKVLVTGGDGFIGSWLLRELRHMEDLRSLGLDLQISLWNKDLKIRVLDLCDRFVIEALLAGERPDVVVLNGAIKGLDACERNPQAISVNVFSQAPFLEYALRNGTHVIFISSDMVFGGCGKPPFAEGDSVAAGNAYGAMKIAGEQLVRMMPLWAIVRTALVYGPMGATEHSRLLPTLKCETLTNQSHLIHWSVARSRCGLSVPLAENILCTPTYIRDLTQGLCRIISTRAKGVYHCSGGDRVSRFDMGRKATTYGGRPEHVVPFQADANELRPMDVSLDNRQTVAALGMKMTSIDDGLRLSLSDRIGADGD